MTTGRGGVGRLRVPSGPVWLKVCVRRQKTRTGHRQQDIEESGSRGDRDQRPAEEAEWQLERGPRESLVV